MPTPNGERQDHPGVHGLAYLSQLPALELCRDIYAGTFRMREVGEKYMPRFEAEEKGDYQSRLSEAYLHNAYRRSVKGLTGMVFRKEPVLGEDVPEPIQKHWENIDLSGRHGRVFAKDVFNDKMIAGHAAIFVDWHTAGDARNRAEEEAMDARPYWILIQKDQIIRHRTENRDGRTVLISFAYLETDVEQVGDFAEQQIFRVRQYDLKDEGVQYRSWTRAADEEDWKVEEPGRPIAKDPKRMPQIPLVVDYADRSGYLTSNPPLEDLAHLNRRHWSLTSDRDALMHTAHVPTFTVIGESLANMGKVEVGTNTMLVIENPEATVQYTEASGSALEQSATETDKIEKRMAQHGLSMLESDTRAAETAASKRIDKTESDSQLAGIASNTQDALEEALKLHAMWMGLDDGGSVEVNTDFQDEPISPEIGRLLDDLRKGSDLSRETLWEILIKKGVLPDTFDPEIEAERLEEEGADALMEVRAAMQREQAAAEPTDPELDEAA